MRITSEIATLRKVILHKPHISLKKIIPSKCQDFLFDDTLWFERAEEEHNIFSSILIIIFPCQDYIIILILTR